jgi:DNA-binding beta-propeller fold protein YncE
VRSLLEGVGRTEDVRFSPSGRWLAFAGFAAGTIVIARVEVDGDEEPTVRLTAATEWTSPTLNGPHGIEFLDETTIVVANRWGAVVVYGIPPERETAADVPCSLEPLADCAFPPMRTPGSVCAAPRPEGGADLFVCNNRSHLVTRHVVEPRHGRYTVTASDVALQRRLGVPDGVAVSVDGWVAVSNHTRHVVMLYERSRLPDEDCDPTAVLRGVGYPHGLRFGGDGRWLFVADAGGASVHVFARPGDSWSGVLYPALSFPVMESDVFRRGNFNAREGGPKGIDLDPSGRVLAVTCEGQPLRCFDADAILAAASKRAAMCTPALDYELATIDAIEARDRDHAQDLADLTQSRSWRYTEPVRRIMHRVAVLTRRLPP